NVPARLIRASALVRMAEPVKARQELQTALEFDPASHNGRWQLAELDFVEGRYQEAEAGFRSLGQTGQARGGERGRQTKSVPSDGQTAVALASDQAGRWPERADVRLAFAKTLIAAQAYHAAAAEFQVLVNKNPGSAELYLQLGEAKLASGDFLGASAAFQ